MDIGSLMNMHPRLCPRSGIERPFPGAFAVLPGAAQPPIPVGLRILIAFDLVLRAPAAELEV
jgi:hypothetical protein